MLFLCGWLILFFISCYYNKKGKSVFVIGVIFLTILFSFTIDNADYINYLKEYTEAATMNWNDTEPIWILLMHIGNVLGLSFAFFRALLFIMSIILMFSTVSKITDQINMVLLLYTIYPFIIDSTQIRNFFAMALLIYALQFLASCKKNNILKYILLVIGASLVHNIFIVYIVLVVVKFLDFKKSIMFTSILFLVVLILFKLLPNIVLLYFSDYHNGAAHADKYVIKNLVSILMIIALALFYFMVVLGAIWANKQFTNIQASKELSNEKIEFMQTLLKCILLISISFLLNIYSMDFSRVLRNMVVVEYAIVISAIDKLREKTKIYLRIMIGISIYACWVFIYYPYSETVFLPIFNNYFFNYLNFG